jgi:hypothetical protein
VTSSEPFGRTDWQRNFYTVTAERSSCSRRIAAPSTARPVATDRTVKFEPFLSPDEAMTGQLLAATNYTSLSLAKICDHPAQVADALDHAQNERGHAAAFAAEGGDPLRVSTFCARLPCPLARHAKNFRAVYFLLGIGGGLRSISVTTAIERAPFFPTARTAKK